MLVAIVALLGGLKHLQGEILRRIDKELVPAINNLTTEVTALRIRLAVVETQLEKDALERKPP
jgi:hypothetical protein